jgi:hypothetical protein
MIASMSASANIKIQPLVTQYGITDTAASYEIVKIHNLKFSWPGADDPILNINTLRIRKDQRIFIIGFIPGYRIYKYSLADGMTVRI